MNNYRKEVENIKFIRDRLIFQHKEDPDWDYMLRLKNTQARLEFENLTYGLHAVDTTTVGVKFSFAHAWVGAHWCKFNKRICITLIPFVTIWIAFKGGFRPREFKLTQNGLRK